MRRDFQIAILLALAAIPAGVSLMAAPEYIGILKEYPGSFFWAGLILAALLSAQRLSSLCEVRRQSLGSGIHGE
jgi:hypothetical protein